MADKNDKWLQNIHGAFYVDTQCIACDACVNEAPEFFEMNNEDGHAFVKLQPVSESDIQKALQALEACPVEAIGKDGKSEM